MKTKIITCLFFIGSIMMGFAQSDAILKETNKAIAAMNANIVAADKSLALSDDQIASLKVIHIERLETLKKIRKEGGTKEAKKAINQKYFTKIFKEILDYPQRKAHKTGKEKNK